MKCKQVEYKLAILLLVNNVLSIKLFFTYNRLLWKSYCDADTEYSCCDDAAVYPSASPISSMMLPEKRREMAESSEEPETVLTNEFEL